jgi:hypothetical protein
MHLIRSQSDDNTLTAAPLKKPYPIPLSPLHKGECMLRRFAGGPENAVLTGPRLTFRIQIIGQEFKT